jgi:hypothetical protein
MRKVLAAVLVSALLGNASLCPGEQDPKASRPAQAGSSSSPSLKQKVLETPLHTMIEVRLLNKEKLRGRLGEVFDTGFVVKTVHQDKIEDRKIAFDEVKSVKVVEGTGSKAGWIVVGALAAAGLTYLIIALAILRNG